MNNKLFQTILVGSFYPILRGLRLLFISSKTIGPYIHNSIYYVLMILFPTEAESRKLVRIIGKSLRGGKSAITNWQSRVYLAHPNTVRHALKNIFVRRFIVCALRRRQLARQGHVIPTVVLISVSTPDTGCNLACEHCYADNHNTATLPDSVFRKILDEQQDLGIYNVRLLGGEPFMYKGIWDIFTSYPNTTFQVPTNGTMLNRKAVAQLIELGNVYPMISLEGLEQSTDAIRGNGVFKRVERAMINCKEAGLPFGTVVTVTRQNREEVSSKPFLQFLDDLHCTTLAYSCYVPLGKGSHDDWQISIEQSEELDRTADLIYENYSMLAVVGRNGLSRVNDCPAAKEFIHILPNSQVEICPFAQFADPRFNVAHNSLLEIMASPFFAGVRELNSLGISGITPCQAPKLESLQTAFANLGAQPTTIATVQIARRQTS